MAQLRFTYMGADGAETGENLDFQHYERAKAAFIAHLNFAQNEGADLEVIRNNRGETIGFIHDSQTVEGRRIKVELIK